MSNIVDLVKEKYGQVAASGLSSRDAGVTKVAEAFGYSAEELGSIPAEANMGLSCGNPTATASLQEGEVVVDLGSGGGLDVFLAAKKVGATGKVIGIDMTPEMINRARRNAAEAGMKNVEFVQASIDQLPLEAGTVDCIISNCVINLAPDKEAVFREMYRVLKPGGRVAVSDLALKRELPAEVARDVLAYVGCIAGAITIDAFENGLKAAGFEAVQVVDTGADLNAYMHVEGQAGCCSPAMEKDVKSVASLGVMQTVRPAPSETAGLKAGVGAGGAACCGPTCCGGGEEKKGATVHEGLSKILAKYDVNAYAASVKVYAVKGR